MTRFVVTVLFTDNGRVPAPTSAAIQPLPATERILLGPGLSLLQSPVVVDHAVRQVLDESGTN